MRKFKFKFKEKFKVTDLLCYETHRFWTANPPAENMFTAKHFVGLPGVSKELSGRPRLLPQPQLGPRIHEDVARSAAPSH